MIKVNVIGAGGHCRSLIPLLEEKELFVAGVFDDSYSSESKEIILNYQLKGRYDKAFQKNVEVVLAVGDNELRKALFEQNQPFILEENIIAKEALVRKSVHLGKSNQIFPFAFINTEAVIGYNNIVNSKALIEHECIIGNHCHISVGAIISGRVTIGDSCFIGAGAIVKDKITICSNVTIGAGAVVVKNINESGVYVGNPLKKIR